MSVCFLLHGFTGSPKEVAPLADHLKSQGFQVHTPTLAGHGGTRKNMKQVTWEDWIAGAEVELKDLLQKGKTVHVVGFSMGGLIAAYLAGKYPVRSLSMLSTPIFYINKKQMMRTIRKTIHQRIMNSRGRIFKTDDEVRIRQHRYASKIKITPLKAVWNFQLLVRRLKPSLKEVTVPLLILQGEKDDLVEPRSAWYIFETAGSRSQDKKIQFFPDSNHMICLGSDQADVNQIVASFIKIHDI